MSSPDELMPIDGIDDWQQRLKRQDAFLDQAVIDRAVVRITVARTPPPHPWPKARAWRSHRDRWMDTEYIAEAALAHALNTEHLGDALPAHSPNLGPEVFSAFFGQEMEYGETTSWSIPVLHDWADAGKLAFSKDNFYWKKIDEITDACLRIGKNRFYTGITDIHPGGDAIAAFRDPMNMNADMIEHPDEIRKLLARINAANAEVMKHFYGRMDAARQAYTCWAGLAASRRWYCTQNDFSCMISRAMFDEFFLEGLREESRLLENSMYHLDGPRALRHLDSLLGIRELNAIQWVYGAGNEPASKWIDVYRRIQAGGKSVQVVGVHPFELDVFFENLRPEGVWFDIAGVKTRDEAESIIRRVEEWR